MSKYIINKDERWPDFSIIPTTGREEHWKLRFVAELSDDDVLFITTATTMYNKAQAILKEKYKELGI